MPIRVKAAGPPGASGRMEKSTRRFSEEVCDLESTRGFSQARCSRTLAPTVVVPSGPTSIVPSARL
ncbi:hypothetical protein M752DRAFT_273213, partial [Aspergillus phoenicis ATCC 13157]